MSDWVPQAITAAGVILAGSGLEATRRILSRNADKTQIDKDLRSEYKEVIQDKRQDAIELKADLDKAKALVDSLEKEIAEWREKYYKSYEERLEVLAKLKTIEERLRVADEQQRNEQN